MKKYSILVIDDQPNWRELLVDLLKDQFDVKSAMEYKGALEMIQSQNPPFHVVVTDMRLKDEETGNEDGLKLINYLNRRGDTTKTIVITGYATISATKRALTTLAAYDYLEKRPSDGTSFDISAFLRLVQLAAIVAEELRFNGSLDISKRILIIEPADTWREMLSTALRESQYVVDVIEDFLSIRDRLSERNKLYDLILIDNTIIENNFNILDYLYKTQPRAGVVLLDSGQDMSFRDLVNDNAITDIFRLDDFGSRSADANKSNFNRTKFTERVHTLLATSKYVFVSFNSANTNDQPLHADIVWDINKRYQLKLQLQNKPAENTWQVDFRSGKANLDVFLYAKHMEVEPGTEQKWENDAKGNSPLLDFSVSPTVSGKKELMIEIRQDFRLLRRILVNVIVR